MGGHALVGEKDGVFSRIHMLIAANSETISMVRSVEVERAEGSPSLRPTAMGSRLLRQ